MGSPSKATLVGASPDKVLNLELTKGDPGGFTLGTLIAANTDYNTIKTAGLYRFVSAGLNQPGRIGQTYGSMAVTATEDLTRVQQTIYPGATGNGAMVQFQRNLAGGIWSAWRAYTSTRVESVAGTAVYQWDELRARDQIIYLDTGWRDITSLILNGWTASTLRIQRFGNTVTVMGRVLNGVAATSAKLLSVNLSGFRPSDTSAVHTGFVPDAAEAPKAYRVGADIEIPSFATYSNARWAKFEWVTDDVAPTSLPGTGIGTVRNL